MRSFIISCLLLVMGATVWASSPVREVTFTHPRGWALVNMPINPVQDAIGDVFTEDDLARVSGADMVVSPYGSNHWRVYLPGTPMSARPIEGGNAYLLFFKKGEGSFTLRGIPWGKSSLSIGLTQGLNLVGMPRGVPAGFTLQSLTTTLGAQALYWIDGEGRWKAFISGGMAPDRAIEEREGFIVYSPIARTVSLPDGLLPETILYVSLKTRPAAIWAMDSDGGNQRQLTFGGFASAPVMGPGMDWFGFASTRITPTSTATGDGFGYYSQSFITGEVRTILPFQPNVAIEIARDLPDDSGAILENDPFPGYGQTLLYHLRYGSSEITRVADGNGDIIQGACSIADVRGGPVVYYNTYDSRGYWLYSQRLGSAERTAVSSPGDSGGYAYLATSVEASGRYLYATRVQLAGGNVVYGSGDVYRRRLGAIGSWEPVFAHPDSDEDVSAISRDGETLYIITDAKEAGSGTNVMTYSLKTHEAKYVTTGRDGNTLVRTKSEVGSPEEVFHRFRSCLSVR